LVDSGILILKMDKTEDEAIVKPTPIKGLKMRRAVYIPFDPPSQIIKRFIKIRSLKEKNLDAGTLFLLRDQVILCQVLGAPAACLSLEILVASGIQEILMLGFCGSLNSAFRINEVVSIPKALSNEGTSKHYFPNRKVFYPSPRLKKKVENTFQTLTLPFKSGSVVSTDAPFRETKSWLAAMQKKRIDLVDMEASAVFAIAEFCQIEAAAVLIVSDELFSGRWKHDFLRSELEQKIREYFFPFI
jgi:purine-nucleoside phosphorylase